MAKNIKPKSPAEQLKEKALNLISKNKIDEVFDIVEQWAKDNIDYALKSDIAQLKSDWTAFKREKNLGVISFSDENTRRNQIVNRLLNLINGISDYKETMSEMPAEAGFEPPAPAAAAASAPPPPMMPMPEAIKIAEPPRKAVTVPSPQPSGEANTEGCLLYSIPSKMPLNIDTKCIVRIAKEKSVLNNSPDIVQTSEIVSVRVGQLMEVELKELGSNWAFEITAVNNIQQFVENDTATEWQFYVKPLKSGAYKLLLKVAIIERINDVDRRKEAVLERAVTVITEGVATPTVVVENTFMPNYREVKPVESGLKTLLFMAANPPGTRPLQLEVEHSRIAVKLNGKINIQTDKFLSAAEIPELMLTHMPNIIHFSGHGKDPVSGESGASDRGIGYALPKNYEKTGGIVVFDENMTGMKVIEDEALDYIFESAVKALEIPIEVVVFNSCHSESQAKVIGKNVKYVVGTSRAIKDNIALNFAEGFYMGLAKGLSVEKAFTTGKMQAVIADKTSKDLIVLYKNGVKV